MKDLTIALNLGKPPENIAPKVLFDKIGVRLDEVIKKAGPERLGKALFAPDKPLSNSDWESLRTIANDLEEEYKIRRNTLLTRLDVTIDSFKVGYYKFLLKIYLCIN